MPPVLYLTSDNSILRAKDGSNFATLACFGTKASTSTNDQTFGMGSMGPGRTADAPGTHFYFVDISGRKIGRCSGDPVTYVAGIPLMTEMWGLYYDQTLDRMYVAYYKSASPRPGFSVAYFDFAETWTILPATTSTTPQSGCLTQIPAGAHANQLIVGWCNDSRAPGTRNVIQRYDGAAWQDDLFLPGIQADSPLQLLPYGDSTVLCVYVSAGLPPGIAWPLLWLRDSAGNWTDITEPGWRLIEFGNLRASCACVFGDDLYVAYYQDSGARSEIWKRTAAGVWSLQLDMGAEGTYALAGFPTQLTVIDGQIYCALTEGLAGFYLRSSGGAWARIPMAVLPQTGTYTGFFAGVEGTITPTSGNCSGEYVDPIQVRGFWDAQAFVAWGGGTVWNQALGLWGASPAQFGTIVYMGGGIPNETNLNGIGSVYTVGQIDVTDSFVLNGRPPNGKGFFNVVVSNASATGHAGGADDYLLYLVDGYEYVCPAIDSVDPATGSINGGYTVTLHGTNFFSNLINPTLLANYKFVVNRLWVRNGLGTGIDPYKIVEVPYRSIHVVDAETITFPMPSYPGGTDAVVEIIFQPAGLAPFGYGLPTGIGPSYRCPAVLAAFDYTGLGDFAILGSLDTVIGLGGTGGDVVGPSTGPGGGGGVGPVLCPLDVTPGPCIR